LHGAGTVGACVAAGGFVGLAVSVGDGDRVIRTVVVNVTAFGGCAVGSRVAVLVVVAVADETGTISTAVANLAGD
jgi:hypothetical protein